jgi:O-antigen ligase
VLHRFQAYGRVCLITAIFLTAVIFYRKADDSFLLPKLTALWVLGILALAIWAIWSAERRVWFPRFRLLYATAGFLTAFALATAFSKSRLVSIIGMHERYGGLVQLVLYGTVALLIVGFYWESQGDLKDIARAAAAGSAVAAAYIVIQQAGLDWLPWVSSSTRLPPGTIGNSNFAGAFLGICLPFLLYVSIAAERNLVKVVLWILTGLNVLALWYTQTRGGMLATTVALVVMVFVYRDRLPRWAKAAVLAGLVAGTAIVGLIVWHPKSDLPIVRTLNKKSVFSAHTILIRSYYWRAAWDIFLDHPIVGTGPETFYATYPKYRLASYGDREGFGFVDKPHSIYFEYAANTGALGLGAYLALVGLAGWYGYRRARRLEGPERLLLTAFLGSLAGYLAQGAVSIDVPPLAAMGWVALGGIAAIADPKIVQARQRLAAAEQQKRKPGAKKNKRTSTAADPTQYSGSSRWPVHVAAGVGAVVLITLGVRPLLADVEARSAQVRQAQRAPAFEVNSYYEKAIKLNPFQSSYYSLAGIFAVKQFEAAYGAEDKKRLLTEALARHRQADRLLPGSLVTKANIAGVYAAWGQLDIKRFADADRIWAEILASDPDDWQVHDLYAQMLYAWAEAGRDPAIWRRTALQLEEVTRSVPKYVDGWVYLGQVYLALGERPKAETTLRHALSLDPANRQAKSLLSST